MPDPTLGRVESAPMGSGLVDEGIQDVRQLTALVGVLKDEGVLLSKLGVGGKKPTGGGGGSDGGSGGGGTSRL